MLHLCCLVTSAELEIPDTLQRYGSTHDNKYNLDLAFGAGWFTVLCSLALEVLAFSLSGKS